VVEEVERYHIISISLKVILLQVLLQNLVTTFIQSNYTGSNTFFLSTQHLKDCARKKSGAFAHALILDSDGRCVQRTGTHSKSLNESLLLGIPRSESIYNHSSLISNLYKDKYRSARAAQYILGHNGPVLFLSFLVF